MRYLYRGLHHEHPTTAVALTGVIVPGDFHGTVSPEKHNRGGYSDVSPYTSWTYDLSVATIAACGVRGKGVILRLTDEPPSGHGWRWVPSPDHHDEDELLLFGIRIDVEVIERELACNGEGEVAEGQQSLRAGDRLAPRE